jgi:hypothetical protein
VRRHREELVQNFQDLEQELASKAALWCFIAQDLAGSLRSEFTQHSGVRPHCLHDSEPDAAVAHRNPERQEPYLWSFTYGYALGWCAGWFGWNWRMSFE